MVLPAESVIWLQFLPISRSRAIVRSIAASVSRNAALLSLFCIAWFSIVILMIVSPVPLWRVSVALVACLCA